MGRNTRLYAAKWSLWGLLGLLTLISTFAFAGNLAREQRISEQLDNPALIGQALWLDAGPVRFLAILEASRGVQRNGGVILLHDAGENADWQQVIAPLRHHLAAKGWDTLSLQMPLAEVPLEPAAMKALLVEAQPRIQAAIGSLGGRGIDNLVLIGHGLGARMALNYLAGKPSPSVHAFVAIGLPMAGEKTDDPVIAAIGKLALPTLDLYGSRDLPAVVDSASARRGAAQRAQIKGYRQDRIEGADHDFEGLQARLQRHVEAWLHRVAQAPQGKSASGVKPKG
jgi:pimeloyl-ACP methyl ester carboxylesterase